MEKLTVELAKKTVEKINEVRRDWEHAHILEDELYLWFIQTCANGFYADATEVYEVAVVVQSTQNIKFARNCS